MEVTFEIKIEDLDSAKVNGHKTVLFIFGWFDFGVRKSAKESMYYIYHSQNVTGLGSHDEILKSNPISVSNNWKKEFLQTFLRNSII